VEGVAPTLNVLASLTRTFANKETVFNVKLIVNAQVLSHIASGMVPASLALKIGSVNLCLEKLFVSEDNVLNV
jgi:hypothetical protein